MSRIVTLDEFSIEPVLGIEPPGMFDDSVPYPTDRQKLQASFRQAVAGTPLAKLAFVPGTDLWLATRDLAPVIDDLARVRAAGVSTIGEAELAGGYAFLNRGVYVFGVEDDSTLLDTAAWDATMAELSQKPDARVRHACDQFIGVQLHGSVVVMTHERSARQYLIDFEPLKAAFAGASAELRRFALAFVPAFERALAQSMPPDRAQQAARASFSNRPEWFSPAPAST